MAKKQKRVKSKQPPFPKVQGVIVAEPGWRAVYGPCQGCRTPLLDIPVEFWTYSVGGAFFGLCRNPRQPGHFFPAPTGEHFVGYARPGELVEDVLAAYVQGL